MIGEFPSSRFDNANPALRADPWAAHRAALLPEMGGDPAAAFATLRECFDDDIEAIQSFLTWHGLVGVWLQALAGLNDAGDDLCSLRFRLEPLHKQLVAHQMMQEAAMRACSGALNGAGVRFVWMKAAAIRSELYSSPGLRPATDLDLLVVPGDRYAAIAALQSAGAVVVEEAGASAHEIVLQLRSVDIDLHWDVLAPGRLPTRVTESILEESVAGALGPRPCDLHMCALALIHPAFAKHVCTRHMGLNRVVDTLRMLRAWNPDPNQLVKLAISWRGFMGARASLYWLSLISKEVRIAQLNEAFVKEDHSIRSRYIESQIDRNWPDFWVERSRAVLGLTFSIWLQDSLSDALKATVARLGRRTERASTVGRMR